MFCWLVVGWLKVEAEVEMVEGKRWRARTRTREREEGQDG